MVNDLIHEDVAALVACLDFARQVTGLRCTEGRTGECGIHTRPLKAAVQPR